MKRSHQQGLEQKCYQKLCKTLDLEERQIKEFDGMSEECGVRKYYQSCLGWPACQGKIKTHLTRPASLFCKIGEELQICDDICATQDSMYSCRMKKPNFCYQFIYCFIYVLFPMLLDTFYFFMTKSLTISSRCRQQQQQIAARNEHVPPHLKINTKRVMYEYLTPHLQ